VSGLSPRETETLYHIARGCTYRQAARRMGISVRTIDTYLRRIRAKTGAGCLAELIRLALSVPPDIAA